MKSSTKSTFRCWEYIFVVAVTTKIALASDICSKTPWSDCICCTGKPGKESTVDAGAENALSCESSSQSLNDADVMITLVWDSNGPGLTTGHTPRRLHLFSHCINPTNTSLGSPLSTVLYNYVRFRHTSSTAIYQSSHSQCSYFGCYEANYGFHFYTFSEVSCTARGAYSAGPLKMTSTVVFSTASTSMQSRSFVHTTDYISYTMTPVTLSPLPSKAFTPTLTAAGTYPGTATWFISLIVVVVLSLIAITTYLVVDKCCTKRNSVMSDLSAIWASQHWTTQVAFSEGKFPIQEALSIHSVHTQYEEMSAIDSPVEQIYL